MMLELWDNEILHNVAHTSGSLVDEIGRHLDSEYQLTFPVNPALCQLLFDHAAPSRFGMQDAEKLSL